MSRRGNGFPEEEKKSLHSAIRNNNLARIEAIFERNRVPQNILNDCLARAKNVQVFDFFIEAGARDTNYAAFFNACCIGNIDMMDRYIDVFRPDVNALSEMIASILIDTFAQCTNTVAVIRRLIQEGANVNYNGGQILSIACDRNQLPVVSLLLESGADPALHGDEEDSGCLYHAAVNHNPQMVALLLEAGAPIFPVMNDAIKDMMEDLSNDTVSDIAATIQHLIRHNIKPKFRDVRAVIEEGRDLSPENLQLLLNTVLVPNISLPQSIKSRLEHIQENENIRLNLQNIVLFSEEDEEKDDDSDYASESDTQRNTAENRTRALQIENEDDDSDYASESDTEEYTQRNTAENRTRALQIEAENEAKRQAALEEYKSTANMDEQPTELKVNTYCYPASHTTLMGDALKDTDDFVIFLVEGNEEDRKGDCYLRSELQEIYRQEPVAFEFEGPPYGISIPNSMRDLSRGPNTDNPVYKLPWTNIWVAKEAIAAALSSRPRTRSYAPPNVIILQGQRQSIGSDFGNNLTGQLGGHWGVNNSGDRAVYVESGNAQPDERPMVYRLVRTEVID